MLRLPTVRIRNKKTGKIRKVNESDWAGDLGIVKYAGWERIGGETHGDENKDPEGVAAAIAQEQADNLKNYLKHQGGPIEVRTPTEEVPKYEDITAAQIREKLGERNVVVEDGVSKKDLYAMLSEFFTEGGSE